MWHVKSCTPHYPILDSTVHSFLFGPPILVGLNSIFKLYSVQGRIQNFGMGGALVDRGAEGRGAAGAEEGGVWGGVSPPK